VCFSSCWILSMVVISEVPESTVTHRGKDKRRGRDDTPPRKEDVPAPSKPGDAPAEQEAEEQSAAQQAPSKGLHKVTKVVLLLSVFPIIYSVPYLLTWGGELVAQNRMRLVYLWGVYITLVLLIFFYFKRKTITLNSLATELMTWAIFSLGVYSLVDIPRMIEIHLRRDVLILWLSLTMVFNLVYLFLDDTPHQENEAKEREKEERKRLKEEERQKKKDEKRKVKDEERRRLRDEKMGPTLKWVINISIYLALAGLMAYFVYRAYVYYLEFHAEQALRNQPVDATIPDDYRQND